MLSSTAGKSATLSDTQQVTQQTGYFLARKIWRPKLLYDSLPYLYLTSGFLAFFATLYISAWFWILPHYLLFSVACVHLGVLVYRRRRRRGTDSDA